MRTQLKLRERISSAVDAALYDEECSHYVEGSISFWFRGRTCPVPASELRQAILDADAQAPWKDETKYHTDLKSIKFLSDGKGGMNNWGPGMEECDMWFSFEPERTCLRKGQVHAYKKYVDNLGTLLVAKGFPSLLRILAQTVVRQITEFKPT